MDLKENKSDIKTILSHQADNGSELWTTVDNKLLKGAPFSALESPLYLLELGMKADDPLLEKSKQLIFDTWREDGRFKTAPKGAMYPCHTALALRVLMNLGAKRDERCLKTIDFFINSQEKDGGWKCNKYSFGRGAETLYSTPMTTLTVLDCFRHLNISEYKETTDSAVEFLLNHWDIKRPIGPCHHGIGSLFHQVEYPFRGYNIFYYVYVLSFYPSAIKDHRFNEVLQVLEEKTVDGQIVVERVVPKLAKLNFCRKGEKSKSATARYNELLTNVSKY